MSAVALEDVLRVEAAKPTDKQTEQWMPKPVRIADLKQPAESQSIPQSESADYWNQQTIVDPVIPEEEVREVSFEDSWNPESQQASIEPELVAPDTRKFDQTLDPIRTFDSELFADIELSIDEVQRITRRQHPALRVASREIDVARAALTTATAKENPRFVVDFETPVHDRENPLELSTRLTFPLGTRRVRAIQYRAAVAEVARVKSEYQFVLEERLRDSLVAAAKVVYWQARLELDLEHERLAVRVIELTQPDKAEVEDDDDPARNTIRHINARLDASRAKEQRFESERALVVARAELAAATGHPQSIRIAITDDLQSLVQIDGMMDNEMLDEIIARKMSASARVASATARLRRDQHLHQGEQERGEDTEMGPTYQDRLGVSDDSAGIRFATDLPLHDNRRGPIAEAAATVRSDRENVRLARSIVIDQINIAYREWQTASRHLQSYHADDFIENQRIFLASAQAADVMTGAQLIEVEQAIIRRQREILDLQFRMAELAVLLRY